MILFPCNQASGKSFVFPVAYAASLYLYTRDCRTWQFHKCRRSQRPPIDSAKNGRHRREYRLNRRWRFAIPQAHAQASCHLKQASHHRPCGNAASCTSWSRRAEGRKRGGGGGGELEHASVCRGQRLQVCSWSQPLQLLGPVARIPAGMGKRGGGGVRRRRRGAAGRRGVTCGCTEAAACISCRCCATIAAAASGCRSSTSKLPRFKANVSFSPSQQSSTLGPMYEGLWCKRVP